jgi:hypothetical protein
MGNVRSENAVIYVTVSTTTGPHSLSAQIYNTSEMDQRHNTQPLT